MNNDDSEHQGSTGRAEPALSKRSAELIFETLQYFANVTTYQGGRTGGVLQGCPRGPAPTPFELADEARRVLDKVEPELRRAALTGAPDPLRVALAELVACQDLQNDIHRWVRDEKTGEQWPQMQPYEKRAAASDELARRFPAAWSAARALVAALPSPLEKAPPTSDASGL